MITDICSNCGKSIHWNAHWRHDEGTQTRACSWKLPIQWATPTVNRTPPVGAEISNTLKAELKRVFPEEFPDY